MVSAHCDKRKQEDQQERVERVEHLVDVEEDEEEEDHCSHGCHTADLLQFQFLKSALSVNPCMVRSLAFM